MKLIKNKIYKIKWTDTYTHSGWYYEEDIDKKTLPCGGITTIGFLIKETKDYIIVAMSYDTDDGFAPYNCPKWIPKGYIKSIKLLR